MLCKRTAYHIPTFRSHPEGGHYCVRTPMGERVFELNDRGRVRDGRKKSARGGFRQCSSSVRRRTACYPKGCAAPGNVQCQCNTREPLSKLERTSPQRKINVTSKSPVGDISVVTLIRTDTTLDHSQKAEKVWLAFAKLTSYGVHCISMC